VVNAGGLLVQSTNMGTFRDADWTAVPQVDAHLGYRITEHLQLRIGYSFLYWAHIVRAGEQIDTTVNRSLIPPAAGPLSGSPRPAFFLNESNLVAHGISLGLEWHY
jgi:hypothetical protein